MRAVADQLLSHSLVASPTALVARLLGLRHLARRIDGKRGRPPPQLIVEPLPSRYFQQSQLKMDSCAGRDQVARVLWKHGWEHFEKPLPIVFALLAKQSAAILDIGANTGYYSLIGAAANPNAAILSFEPVESIALILEGNIRVNDMSGVSVMRYAVSNTLGSLELFMPTGEHGLIECSASLNAAFREQHSESAMVEVLTIDSLCGAHDVGLIKVDVESLELEVLEGSVETIRRCRPVIVLEVLAESDTLNALRDELNYCAVQMTPDSLRVTGGLRASESSPNQLLWPAERIDGLRDLASAARLSLQ